MQLFLIRHAHALAGEDDAARPISAKGRSQVKRVARFLRTHGAFCPDEIWHSPLLRAVETTQLLAEKLESEVPCREIAGLAPESDPQVILRQLAKAPDVLAIVGHEPHLSALASRLVAGRPSPPRFALKKCGVLALEAVKDRWVVCWLVSPKLLGPKPGKAKK